MATKPAPRRAPKTSATDKVQAAKIRATLPPKDVADSDFATMARSLAAFNAEVSRARHF